MLFRLLRHAQLRLCWAAQVYRRFEVSFPFHQISKHAARKIMLVGILISKFCWLYSSREGLLNLDRDLNILTAKELASTSKDYLK